MDEIQKKYLQIKDEIWNNLYIDNVMSKNAKTYGAFIVVPSEGLRLPENTFFDKIHLRVTLIKMSGDKEDREFIRKNNKGEIFPEYFTFNPKTKKVENALADLFICFYGENLFNRYCKYAIHHEVAHLFVEYNKKLNKRNTGKDKQDIYNSLCHIKDNNVVIKKVLFLIYCLLKFEHDANMQGLYAELFYSNLNKKEQLQNDVYETHYYLEYLSKLKEPEKFITKEEINSLKNEDFAVINDKIKKEAEQWKIKTIKNYEFYFRGDKEKYFKNLFDMAKKSYEEAMKRIKKVVDKVYKDKDTSLIKEYKPYTLTHMWNEDCKDIILFP
jgi:hypothetical protein